MKYGVIHQSKYTNATASEIEQEMLSFVGDCHDITYEDTLNVSIDVETLKDLFHQVCVLADPEENLELHFDKSEGDFPTFIVVTLCKPTDNARELEKLYNIKRSVKKMRESFGKISSDGVREAMEQIELIAKTV